MEGIPLSGAKSTDCNVTCLHCACVASAECLGDSTTPLMPFFFKIFTVASKLRARSQKHTQVQQERNTEVATGYPIYIFFIEEEYSTDPLHAHMMRATFFTKDMVLMSPFSCQIVLPCLLVTWKTSHKQCGTILRFSSVGFFLRSTWPS